MSELFSAYIICTTTNSRPICALSSTSMELGLFVRFMRVYNTTDFRTKTHTMRNPLKIFTFPGSQKTEGYLSEYLYKLNFNYIIITFFFFKYITQNYNL